MRTVSLLTSPLLALALGLGCARIPSVEVLAAVTVLLEDTVDESKYEYLGTVQGQSALSGVSTRTGEGNAIATCKGEAYKLGATHIAIIRTGGVITTKVVAKAYRKRQS